MLDLSIEGAFLKICIKDNGVGREKAGQYQLHKTKKSHAIRIIKERLAIHNDKKDSVQITDLYDEQNQGNRYRSGILKYELYKN